MMIFLKTKVDQKKDFQGGLRIPSAIKKYHVSQRGPKGSITSEILIAILDTLDVIGCIDRTDGLKLFLLVDGHGSRFQTDCLRYVIEPTHEWAVCINVPYSTTMWQVGDLSEQNEAYKTGLTRAKEKFIAKKEIDDGIYH